MNIVKQFIKSLFFPKDIAKFRFQGIGKTILYVFFLTFISIFPVSYYLSSAINNGIKTTEVILKEDIPPFVVENGGLSLKSTTPIIVEKEDFKIIFDSTGKIEPKELNNSENTIALLKNEFLFIAGGVPKSYNYSLFHDIKITNKDLIEFLHTLDSLKIILLPTMFLAIFVFSSGIKFIEVTILALFGLFISNLLKRNIPYRQGWRMAAYSATLSTLFFTIMAALQTSVPDGFFINWFVSIIVFTLATKEIPQKKMDI